MTNETFRQREKIQQKKINKMRARTILLNFRNNSKKKCS